MSQQHPQTNILQRGTGLQSLAAQRSENPQQPPQPPTPDGTRANILVWFSDVQVGNLRIGVVSELSLVLPSGEVAKEGFQAEAVRTVEMDVGTLSLWGDDLTDACFSSVLVNGVPLDGVMLGQSTELRHVKITRDERKAILQGQPKHPTDAAEAEARFFPSGHFVPLQEVDPHQYPRVKSEDGREIENPEAYAYRDSMPPELGLQVEWERAHVVDNVRWFRGVARNDGRPSALLFACGMSLSDGDVLKLQLYAGADTAAVPRRINGVKVEFHYGVESPEHGVRLGAPSGENLAWWTALIHDSDEIDAVLMFEHEDEIDRLLRVSSREAANGKSGREALRIALRDHAAFVASVR